MSATEGENPILSNFSLRTLPQSPYGASSLDRGSRVFVQIFNSPTNQNLKAGARSAPLRCMMALSSISTNQNLNVQLGFIVELTICENASLVQREVPKNAEGNFGRRDCILTKTTIPQSLKRQPPLHKGAFSSCCQTARQIKI